MVIEGDAEYQAIAEKMDDAQFVEQRRLAAQEIARVFRIPPHMLGAPSADSMTYSNVEQESIEFVPYSLTPWLRRIELAISNDSDLAFERQFVKFEVDGLLRADAATRSEVYARALDSITGWMDVDEVRALEDLPPQPPREPIAPAKSGSAPPVPAENRSREEITEAIKALASQPPPVVNVNNPPSVRTRHRVVRDEEDWIEAVVDEPEQNSHRNDERPRGGRDLSSTQTQWGCSHLTVRQTQSGERALNTIERPARA
jgi:Phage portal protein